MTTEITPKDATVHVNGLKLHYLDWGNEAAPAMLLLHGTASHAHIWDRFAAAHPESVQWRTAASR